MTDIIEEAKGWSGRISIPGEIVILFNVTKKVFGRKHKSQGKTQKNNWRADKGRLYVSADREKMALKILQGKYRVEDMTEEIESGVLSTALSYALCYPRRWALDPKKG